MSETPNRKLDGVAETLLLPLYIRAMEAKRPDAILKDEKAVALIERLNVKPDWLKQMMVDEEDKVSIVMRNRQFDHYVEDYLTHHPKAAVVHIGCGLDSRFERVDNGQVEWYDLDLPEVIELRQRLIGGEGERYHLLASSALDPAWLSMVDKHRQRPFLFLAEGVLMYFEGAQVKSLFLMLREHFPGAELVFDAFSPLLVRMNNFRIARTKIGARYSWSLKHPKDIEKPGEGITLLDEWYYLDSPEPRLDPIRWVRFIPFLAKVSGIFRYRFGKAVEK